MKKILSLAVLGATLPLAAHAATLTACNFPKFSTQVMPIPSSSYLNYYIPIPSANTSVTQAVPVLSGHIIWDCATGSANWSQCYRSTSTNPCGTAAPTTSTPATNWIPNPVCRMLDGISGTTVNDQPNQKGVSSPTANSFVAGSYCYQ